MIEYSEYKSLVDTLQESNMDTTYQEVMKKEAKVLDTINTVVKYYRDADIKENQFVNLPVHYVIFRFLNVWLEIYKDMVQGNVKTFDKFVGIFAKDDRLIYVGCMCILISALLFFVNTTSNK